MQIAVTEYDALTDRVARLYATGAYDEALAALDRASSSLAPWIAELTHFRACLLGALGRPQAAQSALRSAAARGSWWAESLLIDDDDLAACRPCPNSPSYSNSPAPTAQCHTTNPPRRSCRCRRTGHGVW
ncbi:hypothetical protein [Kribbella turkmenica]|uniref:hypothetical protein n=1 Tax=Kribbella turkmenica TaxID=2530375 RepID=UPI00192DBE01|nr:hypothetical protein [Kribbella turkmenica]